MVHDCIANGLTWRVAWSPNELSIIFLNGYLCSSNVATHTLKLLTYKILQEYQINKDCYLSCEHSLANVPTQILNSMHSRNLQLPLKGTVAFQLSQPFLLASAALQKRANIDIR